MCVQIMGNYQQTRFSYSHFPVVTLVEALGHFPISKIHTKSPNFERFHPVQHNFHTNLDKNIFRTYAKRMCVQIRASINRPDLVYGHFPL